MSEFSVKKPLTIFCATIAILVLGFVAYTRMTPDLLPSMDFPYVIIMTTDPGASPEAVEETITKPMEQSMATLEHIKSIQSTSSDNYSLVMLEFEDDVNLDSIGVDIQQNISVLQAGWDEVVGTPYVLKINPSMIPVMVAAVSMEDMEVTELSNFVNDTLLPQLEGVSGVARITATGTIEQELHVIISQEKIDALNKVLAKAVMDQLNAAEAQLNDAKKQITDAIHQATGDISMPELDEYLPYDETVQQLTDFLDEQLDKLEDGKKQLNGVITQLRSLQDALNNPLAELSQPSKRQIQQQALEKAIEQETDPEKKAILQLQLAALDLNSSLTTQEALYILRLLGVAEIDPANKEAWEEQWGNRESMDRDALVILIDQTLDALDGSTMPPEDQVLIRALLNQLKSSLEDNTLELPISAAQATEILAILAKNSTLPTTVNGNRSEITALESKLHEIENKLLHDSTLTDEQKQELLLDRMKVQMQLALLSLDHLTLSPQEIETLVTAEIKKISDALDQTLGDVDAALDEMLGKLNELQAQINELEELAQSVKDKNFGLDELWSRYDELSGQVAELAASAGDLIEGIVTMSVAMNQIENGLSTLNASRDSALDQVDLNNILSLQTVSQILVAQNFSMPAGYVEQDGINYMVSVGDEFVTEEELGNLMLFDMGLDGVDPIYLRDVADIFITDNSASTYTKLNGVNGVMLSFEKQSNCATAEVSANLTERFETLKAQYAGLEFFPLMDQGDYIYLIVDSILESLLTGALFSILVLFLFLRDLRPTFITLCSIPLSVLFAIVLMYFSGISLNMLSLGGLSIAVGMLVDNSVVVIENIYRLRANGANAIQAAVSGAKQVSGAIVASTLTTVCVFLPIVFVDGITRQLFTDLALTMSYALLASLIVALTLVPAMASGLLKKNGEPKKDIMEKVYGKYRAAGAWALDHKPVIFAAAIGMLVLSAGLSLARGFVFMPDIDSNTISATISFDEEVEQSEAMDIADQVLARIDEFEEVENVGAMMGGSSLLGSSGASTGVTVYITLPEGTSGKAVGNQIVERCADLPCEVTCSASMMDMSMLTGSGISIQLFGDDMEDLQEAAATIAQATRTVEGTTEVSDGLEEAATALHVKIDRNKAMSKGYTVAQIYMQLAGDMTQSATATSFVLDGSSIDVIVETPDQSHITAENLLEQVFTQTDMTGNASSEFTLADVATVEETVSMNTISRIDQKRYLNVTAGVADGYNVTKVTSAVAAALADVELPEGVTYEFSGENETIMESMEQLFYMLLLGLMLVYFVMVAQFQSLKSPFIVMFTIPLAFTGGFLALLLCGMEVSIVSMIGFIMLMGIIVNNGIVLVDYINQLRLDGWDRREAILEAGVTRIRPILMTSLTTILGLVVMAMGKDAGTALMQPMAVVCIGGLLYATLMTLFVVPCIYDLMNKKELRKVDESDLVILTD